MSLEVVARDNDPDEGLPESPAAAEAPASSALSDLKGRVRKAREERILERSVPLGEGPEVVVKFAPIPYDDLEELRKRRRKRAAKVPGGKASDLALLIACDVLVNTCRGLYVRDEDAEDVVSSEEDSSDEAETLKPLDLTGSGKPVTFSSPELAAELGVEEGSAVRTVRALYPTDGDIIGLSEDVIAFSGFFGEENRPNF